MTETLFHRIAGAIFALIALVQALRIVLGWTVVIGSWNAPMWISWVAILIAGTLSYFAFNLRPHA
jgi:hypothetical protein